jgi:hypothetical protein
MAGALITGMEGMMKVAVMSWWTTKGDEATKLPTTYAMR